MSDIEMYAVITIISFYANYAVDCHNISAAAAAGIFVGLNYSGQIISNFVFGTFNILSLTKKCIAARISSTIGIILLIFGHNILFFLAASTLLGVSRSIRSLIYAPAIKLLSGKSDVTNYFAAIPLIALPLSIGIPLISGKLLDIFPYAEIVSYRIIFSFLCGLSFFSIFIIRLIDFSAPDS